MNSYKETLSSVIFEKIGGPTEIEYFQNGPRFQTNSETYL